MTDAATLLALAERCEAASGPDQEMDRSIWWATRDPEMINDIYDRTGYVRQCIERDGSAGKALAQFYDSSKPHCLANLSTAYAYTASLDAAMTLVPEALRVGLVQEPQRAWNCALLALEGNNMDCPEAHASSAALALTAAALRARAHLTENPA